MNEMWSLPSRYRPNGTGQADGVIPFLIDIYEIGQDVPLVSLGSAILSLKYLAEPGERALVIVFAANGPDRNHFYTLLQAMGGG